MHSHYIWEERSTIYSLHSIRRTLPLKFPPASPSSPTLLTGERKINGISVVPCHSTFCSSPLVPTLYFGMQLLETGIRLHSVTLHPLNMRRGKYMDAFYCLDKYTSCTGQEVYYQPGRTESLILLHFPRPCCELFIYLLTCLFIYLFTMQEGEAGER